MQMNWQTPGLCFFRGRLRAAPIGPSPKFSFLKFKRGVYTIQWDLGLLPWEGISGEKQIF